jgi:hypothetical protein
MARNELALLVVVAGLLPLRAGAADTPRPVRTLTFACSVSVAERRETPGNAESTRIVNAGRGSEVMESMPIGNGESDLTARIEAKGSISVDVLSATDDAGLVVEVAESADSRTRPKVRIAVGQDGALFYDPATSSKLTEEEIAVVRWLARGFYGDHPRDPGTSWAVDQSANGHVDVEHYRVVSHDRDRVTLDYVLDEAAAGANGYNASRAGSLVYDTVLIIPVKANFQSSARRQMGSTLITTRSTVALTLTADSFGSLRF